MYCDAPLAPFYVLNFVLNLELVIKFEVTTVMLKVFINFFLANYHLWNYLSTPNIVRRARIFVPLCVNYKDKIASISFSRKNFQIWYVNQNYNISPRVANNLKFRPEMWKLAFVKD